MTVDSAIIVDSAVIDRFERRTKLFIVLVRDVHDGRGFAAHFKSNARMLV